MEKGRKWILIDGVYIGRSDVRDHLDFLIYIDSDYEKRFSRIKNKLLEREKSIKLEEDLFYAVDIYQKEHLEINTLHADLVIDNNDFSKRRVFVP